MTTQALSIEQDEAIHEIIKKVLEECSASAIAVCNLDGNILAEESSVSSIEGFTLANIAALAIGSYAATKELANIIGEPGFKSVFQRGKKSGILIQALNDEFILMMLFSERTMEGLAKLYLKKVTPKIVSVLDDASGQTAGSVGSEGGFEVERKSESAS